VKPIQIILIAGFALSIFAYFARFRTMLRDRIVALVFFAATITFIVAPDLTSTLAHRIGVGRGADLVFYLCLTLFSFLFILLYSKLLHLEHQQTELVRHLAIANARPPARRASADAAPPSVPPPA